MINIEVQNIQDIIPMSDIELGMIFHTLSNEKSRTYHIQILYNINITNFSLERFEKALSLMVGKHEAFRSSFNLYDYEKPLRIIYKDVQTPCKFYDLRNLLPEIKSEKVRQCQAEDLNKSFHFDGKTLVWRIYLFQMDDDTLYLLWSGHHSIIDGWSTSLFFTELNNLYKKLEPDSNYVPSKLKCSYKEFVKEQFKIKKSTEYREFWEKEIAGIKNIEPIFSGTVKSSKVKNVQRHLSEIFFKNLTEAARIYNTSLKNITFAAFAFSLSLLNYYHEYVIGLVTHCRPVYPDGDKVLGCFLNTIPVKIEMLENITLKDFTQMVINKLNQIKKYDRYPIAEILKKTSSNQSDKSIFLAQFNFTDFHAYNQLEKLNLNGELKKGGDGERFVEMNDQISENISFTINTTFNSFAYSFRYNDGIIEDTLAEKFCDIYEVVLRRLFEQKDYRKLDLLDESDYINEIGNKTGPNSEKINEIFDQAVKSNPHKIALKYNDQFISYNELNIRSGYLAGTINNKYDSQSLIGIIAEPSIEYIIGILSILKSGAAFLPIDPDLPKLRIEQILLDSNTNLLLKINRFDNDLKFKGEVISISKELSDLIVQNGNKHDGEHAYLLYTSGSSGLPKGVLVSHDNVINYFKWFKDTTNFYREDKTIVNTSFGFDASYTQIFGSLLTGGELHLCDRNLYLDVISFTKYLECHKISMLHFTPSFLNILITHIDRGDIKLKDVKLLILGGEAINSNDIKKFHDYFPHIRVMNHYGPTETTIASVAGFIDFDNFDNFERTPYIGEPIKGTQVYVFNQNAEALLKGGVGELYIGGQGVSQGYLNQPELTNKKYLPHPLVKGKHLYKTGDIVKWLDNGQLAFLGRIDSQVKIRGQRVELDGVKKHLLAVSKALDVVVTVYPNNAKRDANLIAFLKGTQNTSINEIKNRLLQVVPEYYIPSFIYWLNDFPLNANGKLDIKAILKNEICVEDENKVADEVEKQLIFLVAKVIGIDKGTINTQSNFFELGGHSLQLMSLLAEIKKCWSIDISVNDIFTHPVIENLAKLVKQEERTKPVKIKISEKKEYYPLSIYQKRIYVLQYFNPETIAYNVPKIFKVKVVPDKKRLEFAINQIILMHEVLRASFIVHHDMPVQKISEKTNFQLECITLGPDSELEKEIGDFIQPFDLAKDSLLRVKLIELKDKSEAYLFIDIHHIICDAVSYKILLKDLQSVYHSRSIQKPKYSYLDYSCFYYQYSKSSKYLDSRKYWINQFDNESYTTDLPTDFARKSNFSEIGGQEHFVISNNQYSRMTQLAKEHNVTVFVLLLSFVKILMSKLSNQEEIVVATPVSGRFADALERTMGMFVNTLCLKTLCDKSSGFLNYLDQVKENFTESMDNRDYPFDALVENIVKDREVQGNPIFNVMFVYEKILDNPDNDLIEPYVMSNVSVKADLTFSVSDNGGEFDLALIYAKELFQSKTIERFMDYLNHLIGQILNNPMKKISDLSLIDERERKMIRQDFNQTNHTYDIISLTEIFKESVGKYPDSIALISDNQFITYKQLFADSELVAKHLISKGVKKNQIVGIMAERSIQMIKGIYGIMMAGGVYLPINHKDPVNRIRYFIEDCSIKVLLADGPQTYDKGIADVDVLLLDESLPEIKIQDPLPKVGPDQGAYVIYTSGSTGNPKGVVIQQKSIVNRLLWMQRQYLLNDRDVLIQKTPYTFDVSTWEIFWWFFKGSSLFVTHQFDERNPEILANEIEKRGITVIHFVPSMFYAFLNYIKEFDINKKLISLKNVFCSGETLKSSYVSLFKELVGRDCGLNNLYGPTEAAVDVSYFDCFNPDYYNLVPIGKPIDNVRLYILNEGLDLQPIGVPGELAIAGDCLSMGYVNNVEGTNRSFIPDILGEKCVYLTGDIAKWLPDGNIEFIGRKDQQIKIRGYRIELEEVEKHLIRIPEIKEAVVITNKDLNREDQLHAYFVYDKNKIEQKDIKEALRKFIPEYMLPLTYTPIAEIPLNKNGKLDRKKLPVPELMSTKDIFEKPKSKTEKQLTEIWSEILGIDVDQIVINANFFEIGGSSIKLISLKNKIMRHMNIDLPTVKLFEYNTIKSLAGYIWKFKKSNEGNKDIDPEIIDSEQEEAMQTMQKNLEQFNVILNKDAQ